jgi:hypothetical protein
MNVVRWPCRRLPQIRYQKVALVAVSSSVMSYIDRRMAVSMSLSGAAL